MMSTWQKKWQTLKNINWRWAWKYYRKRAKIYLLYFISKLKGRAFWELPVDGLTVKFGFIHPYHHLFARNLVMGIHEADLFVMWKKQAEAATVTIFDLGGYNGIFGILAAKANPAVTVVIFEPDPGNFKQIEQNIALNNLTNVKAVQVAVADKSGVVSFSAHDGGTSGNIVAGSGDYQVPCITIDDWVAQNNTMPSLMKFDIEGAEYRALLGAQKTLREAPKCNILFELHHNFLKRFGDTEEVVWKFFKELGYDAIWLDTSEFNHHYWVYKTRG